MLIELPSTATQTYCTTIVGPDGVFVPGHVYRCAPVGVWTIGPFPTGGQDTPGGGNPDCGLPASAGLIDNMDYHIGRIIGHLKDTGQPHLKSLV